MRIAALPLALLAGCSFLFVERLSDEYDGKSPPLCTTSYAAPVLDAVIAGMAGGVALHLILERDTYGERADPLIVGNVSDWLLHTIASAWGESSVKRCRKAVRAWHAPPAGTAPPAARFCYRDDIGGRTCFDTLGACQAHRNDDGSYNATRCRAE